jgi:hypothetical protein
MAFNFYGTFTRGQFDVFENFTKLQKLDLTLRKNWLQAQLLRIGVFSTEYDDYGIPVQFVVLPYNSYGAKLLEAYKILGGTPEFDMLLRTRDKPVYLTQGPSIGTTQNELTVGGYSREYSNGRLDRGDMRFDRDLGLKVEKLKAWQLNAIKQKRERLEYKIKRALDYSDQLGEEIKLIDRIMGEGRGSVDDQILDIRIEMRNPDNMNVVDSADTYGQRIAEVSDPTLPDAAERARMENQRGGPGGSSVT